MYTKVRRIMTMMVSAWIAAFPMQAQPAADTAYQQTVDSAFNAKMNLIGSKFYNLAGLDATDEEQRALRFLYAYMPVADATDYPTSYHLGNVRSALRTRREMAWGKDVPELLFRHFVLPMRVNNEPLDSSRAIFYRELKDRVKGMTMKEAILEVNHWCHEHVTYEPSDARTSSPLQTMRTSKGRCGEESTFAVTALRSVGIPARQVYTPRWAHADDNHAWVEAWADGQWWFLGACEPEPVLNLAWFNEPAARALLTHTRAFGDYRGPEEVVLRTSNFTEINLIGNYADTARVDFLVVDADGRPVGDARVEFKIYNYAEYYSAVTKYTGGDGRTFLTAGKGDMVVWASKGGRYGYAKASFGKDKLITIPLANDSATTFTGQEFDMVPPIGQPVMPAVTTAQREENNRRAACEDSLRDAYTATFPTAASLAGYKFPEAVPYIIKSRGNWATIEKFLDDYNRPLRRSQTLTGAPDTLADGHKLSMELLATLSDKDLRDMPADILDDNIEAWDYDHRQICPRVEDEAITLPFKRFFKEKFEAEGEQFRAHPERLVEWVRKNVRLNPDRRTTRITQTPVGVWESRLTDERSRDIFFVDVARSLGIEARKDAVTGKVQYRTDGTWTDVNFDRAVQEQARTGRLVLEYAPDKSLDNPKYYSHFTISKIVDGTARLLNFDEGQVDMGSGTSWANTFKDGVTLDEGTYLLVSGRRMADGTVLARNTVFAIRSDSTTTVSLVVRDSQDGVKVIGSFPCESRLQKDGKRVSVLSQTGRGYYVLGVIAPGQEPTDHALRDIAKMRGSLDTWGRPFVLLFESEADAAKFHAADYGKLPANTIFGIDSDGSVLRTLRASLLKGKTPQLPVFIIADTFDRVVFLSRGYTIGLGEQIKKVADKL